MRVCCRARSSFLSVEVHRSEIVASWMYKLSGVSVGDNQREYLSHCPWKAVFSEQGIFFTAMHQPVIIVCALLNTPDANKTSEGSLSLLMKKSVCLPTWWIKLTAVLLSPRFYKNILCF